MRDDSAVSTFVSALLKGGMLACLALSLPAEQASAQVVKGSISGTVVDPTGASVPGAEVRATEKQTTQSYATTTEAIGAFRLALLPVGLYKLEISKSGFKKIVLDDVEVNAGQDAGLGSFKLEVGQLATTVEVSAGSPLMQSSEAQVTTSIKGEMLTHFPTILSNQGLDSLALMLPGVNSARDNNFSNTNGASFSVNGLRGRNNDQQIDGQNNNDNSVAGPYLFLGNVDFVQEYQITTNNFGPEYGRNSGSVVNIVTKSGTNGWHGTIFGTESNSALNTLSNTQKAFQKLTKVPRFNDEYTGGTIGGPLLRDRVFIFGGFDDDILSRSRVFATGAKTPTPTGLGQIDACFPSSATVAALRRFGPYGITGGNPTPSGNPAPVTLTNPVTGVTCPVEMAGVQRTLSAGIRGYDAILRLDLNGTSNRVYGRWLYQKNTNLNANSFGTGAAGYPNNVPSFGEDFGLSWTRNLSGRMVNEARFSYGRLTVEFGGNSIGNTIPSQVSVDSALARINTGSGNLGFGPASNAPQGRIVNTYQTQDNWSYIRGRHQMKAGFNWTYQRSPNVFLPNLNGTYNFTNYSNFGANRPNTIQIALGNPSLDFREHDLFLYVGDDFRIKSNLMLNLGLTYSIFSQPSNLFNAITTQRESNPSTAFFNPSLPLSARAFPGLDTRFNNWGPSAGFAYTPHWGGRLTGNGKAVLRGGYRIAYDPPFYNIYINISSAAPVVLLQTLSGATALSNPMAAQPFGPAVRSQLASFLTLGVADPRSFNQTNVSSDFGPDKIHSWSFGIQREFTAHAVLEARYAGNHGSDLFQSINANPRISGLAAAFPSFLPSGVTPCPAASAVVPSAVGRVDCTRGVVRTRTNTGTSDYHGLQLEFRGRRIRNQLDLTSTYTWSKTTDNVSEIFGTGSAGNTNAFSQSPFNFTSTEHGLSGLDYPHKWTLSFYEEIPAFRSQHGILGHLLGGWAISGTYLLASGQPYTPVQFCLSSCAGGTIFDTTFDLSFAGAFETARPYMSNPSAPTNMVGIFAGDLCSIDGVVGCSLPPTSLLSLNSYNASGKSTATAVNGNAVRFVVNAPRANTIFGNPFGTAGRNTLRDYLSNVSNAGIFKETRISERVKTQFHVSFVNVFNHPNFSSIDPNPDNAGNALQDNGFADPRLTSGTTSTLGQRQIRFGLKLLF